MNKVFLYLYPIEEFAKSFSNASKEAFKVLNEAIDKRYREKGYKVVFALFPDKEVYGLDINTNDSIIYTDVTFNEFINNKVYPNEEKLLSSLGDTSELIIGGYHFRDCCLRVGETALNKGIDTLVDLDLTDLFFNLYKEDYFILDSYDPLRYKEYLLDTYDLPRSIALSVFDNMYKSLVYGFKDDDNKRIK